MIQGINHITLAVKEIDRSFSFYRELLGFKPLCKWEKGAYFLAGDVWFCLNVDERRIPNPCYTHYAFTVASADFEKIKKRLLASNVFTFKNNNSPGESFYFLDPDAHKIEIHTGDWQARVKAKKTVPGTWKEVQWFI